MNDKKHTLCWECTRPGTGGCAWDRKLEPVEGWEAEPTTLYAGNKRIDSWRVTERPLYRKDRRVLSGPSAIVEKEVKDRILAEFRAGGTNEQVAVAVGLPRQVIWYHKCRFKRLGLL